MGERLSFRRGAMTDTFAKTPVKSLTPEELAAKLRELGEPAFRAKQVFDWIYAKRAGSFAAMTNLSASLRERLGREFRFDILEPVRKLGSADTTQKYLFRLADGSLIETVLIPASPALYGRGPIAARSASPRRSDARSAANSARAGWEGFRAI